MLVTECVDVFADSDTEKLKGRKCFETITLIIALMFLGVLCFGKEKDGDNLIVVTEKLKRRVRFYHYSSK